MFLISYSILLPLLFCNFPEPQEYEPVAGNLMTQWAQEVCADQVLPEYPRPMMERPDWMNLNGLWQFALCGKDEERPEAFDQKILVPFPAESALSGVKKRVAADQRLWYCRTFTLPEGWASKRILLHFEAVDWETKAWVNGHEVGSHQGGYDPFFFDVTRALKEGGLQELVVSVFDPSNTGQQPRGKQVLEPGGIFYTAASGIWQTVWLEPVPGAFIEDVRMTPDIFQRTLSLTVLIDRAEPGDRIRVEARDHEGQQVGEAAAVVGDPLVLRVLGGRLWTPDDPYLFDLDVMLMRGDQLLDQVQSYFGMRKISLAQDDQGCVRMKLNRDFLFQIGPLDQGFWPDGIYTAPTDEALRFDLEALKKMGFNMLRKHVKVESRRFYTWCDRLGLLVWQDMPSGGPSIGPNDPDLTRSPEAARQFEKELIHLIGTKFNHPSIVVWVPFNEGWGQYDTERIAALIKRIDPTRLVDAASGWTDRGVGDLNDIHAYPGPAAPMPDSVRARVLGEFGGLGLNVEGHTWGEQGWGYDLPGDRDQLALRYEELLSGVHRLQKEEGLCAAVYTQTTDIESENNGLLTYDRAVHKIDPERVALANQGFLPPQRAAGPTIFLDEILVKLAAQRPDATIYYTLDGSEPERTSLQYKQPFSLKETTTLKARSFWDGDLASRTATYTFTCTKPAPAQTHLECKPGLQATWYEGQWDKLPNFSKLHSTGQAFCDQFDLSVCGKTELFGLVLQGLIRVPTTGIYTLYLTSDDGSRLRLNDEILVENDGLHGMRTRTGYAALEAGLHSITVDFFQRLGGLGLQVHIEGPAVEKQEIAPDQLFHN